MYYFDNRDRARPQGGNSIIQEPFLGNQNISHPGFNLYWSSGMNNRKDMQVIIVVRKDLIISVIKENRTNFVSHPYYIILDIKEQHHYQEGLYVRLELTTYITIRLEGDSYGKSLLF